MKKLAILAFLALSACGYQVAGGEWVDNAAVGALKAVLAIE